MSEQTNTCPKCGGQKVVYYQIEPTYSNNFTSAALYASSSSMRICTCPIEREKHDGKLDEEYRVYQSNGAWGVEGVILEYKGTCQAIIRPQQALSLLAWLKQEQSTLER